VAGSGSHPIRTGAATPETLRSKADIQTISYSLITASFGSDSNPLQRGKQLPLAIRPGEKRARIAHDPGGFPVRQVGEKSSQSVQ
jgi:hypothetical protein